MQITIDSKEPLSDALRVLGAAYGVILTTDQGNEDAGAAIDTHRRSDGQTRTTPARSGRKQSPRRSRSVRAATGGTDDPKTIRQWARENGIAVSGRGALSATVRDAYRSANTA